MKNKLTIVIPCKNEGINLINTIKSSGFKKIVVADSSDDNTIELLKELSFKVKVVEGGFPAKARNNGAKIVNTPYILFLDSDITIKDENLIWDCLIEMEKNNLDLCTVRITTNDFYKIHYLIFDFLQFFLSKITPFAVGGFMLFRTDKFNELGGFCDDDKFAEDYNLSKKIHPKKFKILNKKVFTSSRRFKKKGIVYIIKMMILSFLNRNNPKFFKSDWNYWN